MWVRKIVEPKWYRAPVNPSFILTSLLIYLLLCMCIFLHIHFATAKSRIVFLIPRKEFLRRKYDTHGPPINSCVKFCDRKPKKKKNRKKEKEWEKMIHCSFITFFFTSFFRVQFQNRHSFGFVVIFDTLELSEYVFRFEYFSPLF